MITPFLSIIIPVYNVENYIFRCLTSLYSQDIEEELYEVIIVNDGTPDNSMTIVDEFVGIHSNLVIVNKKNGGVSSARNAGIELSRGKFLLFVDPDDTIAQDSLSKIYKRLSENFAEIIILNSVEIDSHNANHISLYPFSEEFSGKQFSGVELFSFYNRGSICGVVFNRMFILKNEINFNEELRNGEDSLFFSYCLVYADLIYHMNIDYYLVHRRNDSASTIWDYMRIYEMANALNSIEEMFEKNSFTAQQAAILNYRAYQTISNMFFRFIKINKFSKYYDLKRVIKNSSLYPINSKHINRTKRKIRILNFSIDLFVLIFLVREKLAALLYFNR